MSRFWPEGWSLPLLDDKTRPFFTSGKVVVQKCAGCGTVQHPPEDACHNCLGMQFEYPAAKGTGTVYSYTIVHHPVHPLMADLVPYAVVLVALDDYPHVRYTGNMPGTSPGDVRIGMPVRATFDEVQDDLQEAKLTLPQWQRA